MKQYLFTRVRAFVHAVLVCLMLSSWALQVRADAAAAESVEYRAAIHRAVEEFEACN